MFIPMTKLTDTILLLSKLDQKKDALKICVSLVIQNVPLVPSLMIPVKTDVPVQENSITIVNVHLVGILILNGLVDNVLPNVLLVLIITFVLLVDLVMSEFGMLLLNLLVIIVIVKEDIGMMVLLSVKLVQLTVIVVSMIKCVIFMMTVVLVEELMLHNVTVLKPPMNSVMNV